MSDEPPLQMPDSTVKRQSPPASDGTATGSGTQPEHASGIPPGTVVQSSEAVEWAASASVDPGFGSNT